MSFSDPLKQALGDMSQAVTIVDLEKIASSVESTIPEDAPHANGYPVHTKEATLLSAAYQVYRDGQLTPAMKAAVCVWGCESEAEEVASQILNRPTKEPKYAVDMDIAEIGPTRLFPYIDADSLKQAGEAFYKNRTKFGYQVRRKTASTLIAEASAYGVDYDDHVFAYLEKAAGYGLLDKEALDREVLVRQATMGARRPEDVATLAKIAALLDVDCADSLKTATQALADFDEGLNLTNRYGTPSLRLPEESISGVTATKLAADIQGKVELANGSVVTLTDIDWAKVAEFDPALAEEVAGDLEKAAEVLPTWPRPDADILVAMLGLE